MNKASIGIVIAVLFGFLSDFMGSGFRWRGLRQDRRKYCSRRHRCHFSCRTDPGKEGEINKSEQNRYQNPDVRCARRYGKNRLCAVRGLRCVGKAGACDENKQNAGVSHFIEHMMFKGTEKRNARQIAEEIDRIGGQINAFTGKEATCYYVKTIGANLEKGAEVILDMLNDSVFDKHEMTKERTVIFEEMKMIEDQPDDLAHDTVTELVFKGNPLGKSIIGNATSLRGISRNVMTAYKEAEYTRDSIVVSIAGNFDEERFYDFLEGQFAKLRPTKEQKQEKPIPYTPDFKVLVKEIQQPSSLPRHEGGQPY